MRHIRWMVTSVAAIYCGLACPAVAKADFEGDVESIIEQVIEDNVATQVVPNAAKHFNFTCDLVPASVYALEAKRYNGFSSLVRQELAGAAGLLTTLAIDGGNMSLLPAIPSATPAAAGASASKVFHAETIDLLTELLKVPGITLSNSASWKTDVDCAFLPLTKKELAQKSPPLPAPKQSVATSLMQGCATTQDTLGQELGCSVGLAVRDAIDGNTSSLPSDAERALVAVAGQLVLEQTGTTFPAAVLLLEQALGGSSAPSSIDAPANPLAPAASPPDAGKAAASRTKLVETLAAEISTLSKTSGQTIDQIVAAVTAFGRKAATLDPNLSSSIALVRTITLAGGDFAIIREVQAKNYGAAAGDAFDEIDSVICPPKTSSDATKGCNHIDKDVRRFLKSAAVYAIDAATEGSANASASADFRAAAVDLIEDTGGAGIRRKTWVSTSGQHAGAVFPNVSLRAALRPGFVGPTNPGATSSPLTTYASLDWPSLRWKMYPMTRSTNPLWLGGNVSLFDALGPFIELAARSSSTVTSGSVTGDAFVLGFFVPRLDFEFGIPELTKNLVVGVGTAWRLYRVDQSPSANPTYCFVWQNSCANGAFTANNFEGSVFIKFVP